MRKLWPEKGQPGRPWSTRQGQGRASFRDAPWSRTGKGLQREDKNSEGRESTCPGIPRLGYRPCSASACVT